MIGSALLSIPIAISQVGYAGIPLVGLCVAFGYCAGFCLGRVLEIVETEMGVPRPQYEDLARLVFGEKTNLAITRFTRGDLAGAEALQREVLEARERTLGAQHPDTVLARENLAVTLEQKRGR